MTAQELTGNTGTMNHIQRLLIANRGEIACRIMRTAKALGIETVAVYSDADADALHVQQADQAVHIGAAAPAESYLNMERILAAAAATSCNAIHPGYGFLSENAAFAEACQAQGITFVGPSAAAIDLMGDKARAKRAMLDAGVPCIPGYQDDDQSDAVLSAAAAEIGYPLMIKAAAGGGGRGMRLVHNGEQLANALDTARSEAINAFGAGELILEKAIQRPRHVEVQVFGDQQGNLVYLAERDCSVQRRHQKVIEEAPCPVMTDTLRQAMGSAAVAAARAVDYVGAGTVEFLLAEDGNFYFLEMNTRLQVEHPVTELITGLDLVALQLQVANGAPLGFNQDDVVLSGHAIEVRLYAEDPRNDFLPSTGHIEQWQQPSGPGVRVDTGFATGSDISPFYDPMLAKVIAHGENREQARQRLRHALARSALAGPATNRDFLIDALGRAPFIEGAATTAFIEEQYGTAGYSAEPSALDLAMAATIHYEVRAQLARAESIGVNEELYNWSSAVPLRSVFCYRQADELLTFTVQPTGGNTYQVTDHTEQVWQLEVQSFSTTAAKVSCDGIRHPVNYYAPNPDRLMLATTEMEFSITDVAGGEAAGDSAGDGRITAPMHGQLLEVFVAAGDHVVKEQRIALLEAMKMQHEILADVDGTVTEVAATPGQQISMDELILSIDPQAADS